MLLCPYGRIKVRNLLNMLRYATYSGMSLQLSLSSQVNIWAFYMAKLRSTSTPSLHILANIYGSGHSLNKMHHASEHGDLVYKTIVHNSHDEQSEFLWSGQRIRIYDLHCWGCKIYPITTNTISLNVMLVCLDTSWLLLLPWLWQNGGMHQGQVKSFTVPRLYLTRMQLFSLMVHYPLTLTSHRTRT